MDPPPPQPVGRATPPPGFAGGGAGGPLTCPGCGYNLHGVCTAVEPAGACPECGLAFHREALLHRWRVREGFSPGAFVMQLFALPGVFVLLPWCCVVAPFRMMDLDLYVGYGYELDYDVETVFFFLAGGWGLLAAAVAGWVFARRYHAVHTLGVPPHRRRWPHRYFFLTWLALASVEMSLALFYSFCCCGSLAGIFGW